MIIKVTSSRVEFQNGPTWHYLSVAYEIAVIGTSNLLEVVSEH